MPVKSIAAGLLSKCVANKFTSAWFQEIFNVLFSEMSGTQKFNKDNDMLEWIKSGLRAILQSEAVVPDFWGPRQSFGKGHPLCR